MPDDTPAPTPAPRLTLAESLRHDACDASAARREAYARIVPLAVAWHHTGGRRERADALLSLARAIDEAGL